ncbi:tRNA lysidine(34) synthetase TilS [Corynebacterium pygosceleis]|uniref:tRNA(Ile)-lysidine synthase n=1 Tax=Corynebacterium pygosceleis TaxID=2800406 RepID=A0A9Q4C9G0_9CORY|nr:tRNA lysidine(34) synthetase TilS [Corynebacterium pygosceleis]MCK7638411.1 tRNA lysidine(34) synthetase TilS [Corynebacterium pygosceleis]MCK7675391.1 tRNA lysidine(34) synthetase TilS [Corynebacterium pygosceleis]MCL0121215.1 tRNA lysidine(34) synthetase TilS [Corynebacterium pygosceleis]MCX7469075.1 tRNA lysidine(34) synthetase TilS [Corynebacterium pygosceleis]
MPARIGDIPVPRTCPHFLTLRLAVRRSVPVGNTAVLGVSGGPDSLMLAAAALAEGVTVHAVCVDHGLQSGSGEQAERAAAQVRRMGGGAEVVAVDISGHPGGTESAARTARYAALAAVATRRGTEVWVGHTLDDRAETMLLAALRGLPGGLAERGTVPGTAEHGAPVPLTRPFLHVRRADTVGASRELGITPWYDPHNSDTAFRRVALRREILPALGGIIGGDAAPALAEASAKVTQDSALLDALAEEALRRRREDADCTADTDLPVGVGAEHPALRRRILGIFLRANGATVSTRATAGVDRLLTDWHGQGPVAVGGTTDGRRLVVARRGGILTVSAR